MPIYEYLCKGCGHEFEREQRITDKPVRTCPKCKARKVQRLISQTSFVLKGGGWYSDLYSSAKKDSGGAAEKPAGEAASKTESPAKSETVSKADDASKGSKKSKGKKAVA